MARYCSLCGHQLDLLERLAGENAIPTRDGREVCPACYLRLNPEEQRQLFN